MTAPEASVTVPVILALMSCPRATEHTRNTNKLLKAMRTLIGSLLFNFSFSTCLNFAGSSFFKRCGPSLDLRLVSLPEDELRSASGLCGESRLLDTAVRLHPQTVLRRAKNYEFV